MMAQSFALNVHINPINRSHKLHATMRTKNHQIQLKSINRPHVIQRKNFVSDKLCLVKTCCQCLIDLN